MAELIKEIRLCEETRLCYVVTREDQTGEKCIFHRWIERPKIVEPLPVSIPAGILYAPPVADKQTLALVENELGQIQAVEPEKVIFADGRALEAWQARDKEPDVKTTLWCNITKCKNNKGERCTLDCTSIRGFSLANGKFFQMCDGYEEAKTTKQRRT